MEFSQWRAEFVDRERYINFNHSGIASVPRRVVRAVTEFIQQATAVENGIHGGWKNRTDAVRASFAQLIGAHASEIAFIDNTSHGLSLVAAGRAWKAGENVVAIDGDYPSNVYPWWGLRRFDVETRMVSTRGGRFGVDDIRAAVDARTRVVAVSAVDWQTGFRCDLQAIGAFCREHSLLFVVDGIQAVGALPIDVERDLIDCMAVGGHKWLLSVEGCGCLFVSQRVLDQLQPLQLGWKSVTNADNHLPYHLTLRPDAARFESGSPAHLNVHALGAALDLLLEVGATAVRQRILALTTALSDGLRRRGAEVISPWGESERSGILTFRSKMDPARVTQAMEAKGIICRVRAGGVRLAPHFYNNEDDIERFFSVLDAA